MRIWFSLYTLEPLSALSSRAGGGVREGALLKVETPHGIGYADLHPWEELGDLAIQEQLAILGEGKTTPLSARSLELAAFDAKARAEKRSSFDGLAIPKSHYLVNDIAKLNAGKLKSISADGFTHIKLKMGRKLTSELEKWLALAQAPEAKGIRWRFDFNASVSFEQVVEFAAGIPTELKAKIDFIEDPIAWDAEKWKRLKEITGLRFALDRSHDPLASHEGATARGVDGGQAWIDHDFDGSDDVGYDGRDDEFDELNDSRHDGDVDEFDASDGARYDGRDDGGFDDDIDDEDAAEASRSHVAKIIHLGVGSDPFSASIAFASTELPSELSSANCDVLILKPALQNPQEVATLARAKGLRLVVTSYLDHPVGQVGAALEAARLAGTELDACGLVSHLSYQKNEFSERLKIKDACLVPPQGTGIGFDDLLEAQDWWDL